MPAPGAWGRSVQGSGSTSNKVEDFVSCSPMPHPALNGAYRTFDSAKETHSYECAWEQGDGLDTTSGGPSHGEADKELCLREALAVCTPPAPEPSASVFPSGTPVCRGTFGGRMKAVRDCFALQV